MLNFGNKEFRNLQEQVLENAKNIQILKERPGLKPVVVAELPTVGEVNILYLVPKNPDPDTSDADSYDEYVWLPETQTYEFVGSTSLNLSNMVTTDTKQTITGQKTFTSDVNAQGNINVGGTQYFYSSTNNGEDWNIKNTNGTLYYERTNLSYSLAIGGSSVSANNIVPKSPNSYSLGGASTQWKDLYLSGKIDFGNNVTITKDSSNRLNLNNGNNTIIKVGGVDSTYCAANWTPDQNATYDLGSSNYAWKDLYLAGNISDGANTVSVADIASKVTSTFISGTFDANGESTIDTEQAGTPEGLFIFTYGNCQCFLRLTAAMVNSADTAPIRVSCPMIYNGATSLGWLNITKSGYILLLKVTDGTNHVDSGYSWTLTKTNLI